MLTTQELHNSLSILLQKSSTHWNKNFLPQEYDWFINQEISKFIKQRINPLSNNKGQGAFDITKRVQDLNCLERTVVIEGVQNEKEMVVPLPLDYKYYISSSCYVSCTSAPITRTANLFKFSPFSNYSSITSLSISATIPVLGTVVLFVLSDIPASYLPQDDIPTYKKDFIFNNAVYMLIRRKLETIQTTLYQGDNSYTQNTEPLYSASTYIGFNQFSQQFFLSGNLTNVTIILNGIPAIVTNGSNTFSANPITSSITKQTGVNIVDEEFKMNIENSYLSKPSDRNTVAYLRQFYLKIPKASGVMYHGIRLTYYCEPRKIDLLLNQHSELPEEMLEEIVHNTAKQILGVIGSDGYEKYMAENMLIE